MGTIAVKKITALETESSSRAHSDFSLSFVPQLVRSLIVLIGIGIFLSVVLGLVQKWLWVRQPKSRGMIKLGDVTQDQ
jgi:hypothetical protein